MGSFYSSYSIKGNFHEEARRILFSWLNAKGFELADTLPVTELDKENERGIFLYWNKKWVVILYSNIEEESRLRFDLKQIEAPLLHLWVHDSDVWGYELYKNDEMISAFSSNPNYIMDPLAEDVPNNIENLCQLCDIPNEMETVLQLQRKKSVFREQICEKFAELLEVEPAASSYDYNESEWELTHPSGFHKEHLVFRDQNWNPMNRFDIHEFNVSTILQQKKDDRDEQQINVKTMEEELANIRQTAFWVHKAFGCLSLIIKPILMIVFSPFYIARWIQRVLGLNRASNMNSRRSQKKIREINSPYRVQDTHIVNDWHSCRIRLMEGAVVNYDLPGSSSISSVFAFEIDKLFVSCRTIRPNKLKESFSIFPPNAEIIEENRTIGPLNAKMIRITMDIEGLELFREFHEIQAPKAIYEFSVISDTKPSEETLSKIRHMIDSFEFFPEQKY